MLTDELLWRVGLCGNSAKMFCEGPCLIYVVIKERDALGEMFTFGPVALLKRCVECFCTTSSSKTQDMHQLSA